MKNEEITPEINETELEAMEENETSEEEIVTEENVSETSEDEAFEKDSMEESEASEEDLKAEQMVDEKQKDLLNETLENLDIKQMLDFTKRIHELVKNNERLQELEEDSDDEDIENQEEDNVRNTKSNEEVKDILGDMLRAAGVAQKKGIESRFKVPTLRFADLKKLNFTDKKSEIENSGKKLWDEFKIKIRLIKRIDTFDVNKDKEKYVIELRDNNDNVVVFDYLDYQKKIYDFTVDEEQLLQDEIVKLRGTYDADVIRAAKEAAKYISLCLAFNEMLVYRYKYIGWQTVYHNVKDNTYEAKYKKQVEKAKTVFEDFCAAMDNGINKIKGNSTFGNNDIENVEKFTNNLKKIVERSLHLADDLSEKEYTYGRRELIFKYDKIYSCGPNRKREGFCGEDWAKYIDLDDYDEDNYYTFNIFFAHTFNNSTKASLILCAAVSGIIKQMLDLSKEYGININIHGEAASGKSTLQNLVLSFFGDPNGLAASFIDTDNIKEEERVARVLIPYVIDDKLLNSFDASDNKRGKEAFFDIFREYEGRNKQRYGKKTDNSHRFHGAVIGSSVESIFELMKKSKVEKDFGQIRRLIEIEIEKGDVFKGIDIKKFNGASHAEAANDVAKRYYGYGVPQVIKYMFLMMKYQYLYNIFLSCGFKVADTFRLVNSALKIMEFNKSEECKNSEELIYFLKKIEREKVLDYKNYEDTEEKTVEIAEIRTLLDILISNNIVFQIDENNEGIFHTLLFFIQQELKDKFEKKENYKYYAGLESSKQRFSLIILTGYIINYALSYTKFVKPEYVSGDANREMDMDMDGVAELLIKNYADKIERYDKDNRTGEETKNIDSKQPEPTVQDIINIYDWLITNQKYFYIDEIGTSKDVNINDSIKQFIGRIRIEDGVGLKLVLHTNDKLKIFNAICTCDNDPENILKYKYERNIEGCKLMEQEIVDNILKINDQMLKHVNTKNFTLKDEKQRGVEYLFNIKAIEEAREAFNQQNQEEKSIEDSNLTEEQNQEIVENQTEVQSQEEKVDETN